MKNRTLRIRYLTHAGIIAALYQVFHGQNVGLSQVSYVDVVADTGTVLGIIVVTKDRDFRSLTIGNL